MTAIAGRVLRLDGLPLAGVTMRSASARTETDRAGRFLLENVQPGRAVVTVDATTANRPGAGYGIYELGVETKRNHTAELPFTVWSPRLDTEHEIELDYPLRKDVVLRSPSSPDSRSRFPPGRRCTTARGARSAGWGSRRCRSTAPPSRCRAASPSTSRCSRGPHMCGRTASKSYTRTRCTPGRANGSSSTPTTRRSRAGTCTARAPSPATASRSASTRARASTSSPPPASASAASPLVSEAVSFLVGSSAGIPSIWRRARSRCRTPIWSSKVLRNWT